MKAIYVNQLPPHVRAEIRRDAYRINREWYGDGWTSEEIMEVVEECVMCSRVKDVLGTEEEGLLDFEKYARFA